MTSTVNTPPYPGRPPPSLTGTRPLIRRSLHTGKLNSGGVGKGRIWVVFSGHVRTINKRGFFGLCSQTLSQCQKVTKNPGGFLYNVYHHNVLTKRREMARNWHHVPKISRDSTDLDISVTGQSPRHFPSNPATSPATSVKSCHSVYPSPPP